MVIAVDCAVSVAPQLLLPSPLLASKIGPRLPVRPFQASNRALLRSSAWLASTDLATFSHPACIGHPRSLTLYHHLRTLAQSTVQADSNHLTMLKVSFAS